MKFQNWLVEWLENYVRPTSKSRTYERYAQIVFLHIAPRLGAYELEELTPVVLQRLVTSLLDGGNVRTGNGLSPNSVNGVISVLRVSLKAACSACQLSGFPADGIKRPKTVEKKVTCFTPAEQKKIERAVLGKSDKMFGVVLCLYTGLRIGELLALEWSDVDLRTGMLNVSKSCHDGKCGGAFERITDTPKTLHSTRTIPVPRQLLPALRELKKRSLSRFVVSSSDGCTVYVRSYQRSFSLLLQRLNIPHRGFHSLRHTFATRAVECGMDIKTLSELLGHKNASVTLSRYAHSLTEHKIDMMNRLGKLL